MLTNTTRTLLQVPLFFQTFGLWKQLNQLKKHEINSNHRRAKTKLFIFSFSTTDRDWKQETDWNVKKKVHIRAVTRRRSWQEVLLRAERRRRRGGGGGRGDAVILFSSDRRRFDPQTESNYNWRDLLHWARSVQTEVTESLTHAHTHTHTHTHTQEDWWKWSCYNDIKNNFSTETFKQILQRSSSNNRKQETERKKPKNQIIAASVCRDGGAAAWDLN